MKQFDLIHDNLINQNKISVEEYNMQHFRSASVVNNMQNFDYINTRVNVNNLMRI